MHSHEINISVDRSHYHEFITGITWTVFFSRLLGPMQPKFQSFLNSGYPTTADSPELADLIASKTDKLLDCIDSPLNRNNNLGIKYGKLTVNFVQKVGDSWLQREQPWEVWHINVTLVDTKNVDVEFTRNLAHEFQSGVLQVMLAASQCLHIPQISAGSLSPFGYDIQCGA